MTIATTRVDLSSTPVEIATGPGSVAVILQSRAFAKLECTSAETPGGDDTKLTLDTYTRQLSIELDAGDRIFGNAGSVHGTTVVVIQKT